MRGRRCLRLRRTGHCGVRTGVTPGETYYYVVSADTPNGESADSAEISAVATAQLLGTVIGT